MANYRFLDFLLSHILVTAKQVLGVVSSLPPFYDGGGGNSHTNTVILKPS